MKKKRMTWKFERMPILLQAMVVVGCAVATIGYILGGSWILWMIVRM